MAKSERPLTVDIPRPGSDQPAWSRVGIIGVLGFVLGIVWPRVAGVKIGPAVPADLRAQVESSASPAVSTAPHASTAPTAGPASSAAARLIWLGAGKFALRTVLNKCYTTISRPI